MNGKRARAIYEGDSLAITRPTIVRRLVLVRRRLLLLPVSKQSIPSSYLEESYEAQGYH